MDKVLFISRNYPPAVGGIETMAQELLNRGIQIRPEKFIFLHFGQKKADNLPDKLWRYHHFPAKGILSTFFFSSLIVPWFFIIHKPVQAINMQVTTGFGSMLASKLLDIPYAVITLGLEILPSHSRPFNFLRKMILINAWKVLSISRYTDCLVAHYGVAREKRTVILLGSDPNKFTPESSYTREQLFPAAGHDDFICLSICRLITRKGIDTVIKAIALAVNGNHKLKYYIGGTGPGRKRLEDLVKKNHLEKTVYFLGYVSQEKLSSYYAVADLFLQPGRSSMNPPDVEGFGVVFLEAGACGTASIGSKCGGIPEAIVEGKTGCLVEPGNEQDVADKILFLKNNPNELKTMGDNARVRVVDELNWNKVSSRYISELFREAELG